MKQNSQKCAFDLESSTFNCRLDHLVKQHLPHLSRSEIKQTIETGAVSIDNITITKASTQVLHGKTMTVTLAPPASTEDKPQELSFDILYEDSDILIINKPAGMLVHPGSGQKDNTLLNALLHRYPDSKQLPRAGIVHRLDKLTSGVLVIAKTMDSCNTLIENFKNRSIQRTYHAIAHGVIYTPKIIEAPIGRHPKSRTLMSVNKEGNYAKTLFNPIKRWKKFTLLECQLFTGKTHQIRVHAQYIKHSLYGDPQYGRHHHLIIPFNRQALHAYRLQLTHPITHTPIDITCPYPTDLSQLINNLNKLDE